MTIRVGRNLLTLAMLAAAVAAPSAPAAAAVGRASPIAPATAVTAPGAPVAAATAVPLTNVVPAPVSTVPAAGVTFTLSPAATIYADAPAMDVAGQLATILRRSTGYPLPIVPATGTPADGIALLLSGAPASVGAEGYQLDVSTSAVTLRANQPAGLFNGVQTLRQVMPPEIEATTVQPGPWTVAGGRVVDYPRFAYRGAMLDVARHFFGVAAVERYLDEITLYKVNRLHLHLSDDQGWRIAINSWPNLATYGGSTAVGGGAGGYFTQADYQAIVAYAAARYVTIVPEIDSPGHTNAALASYAELNCDGVAPKLYTGTKVGFSSLCVSKEITYTFLDQVWGEIAAMTPGSYLHVGGDEASSTTATDYQTFMGRAQQIVAAKGKAVMGWHDIVNAPATVGPSTVAQFWGTTTSNTAVASATQSGVKVVMSPANHAYLDMKYNRRTKLGQSWAGFIEVQDAYGWDPGTYLSGVTEASVLGVEAPLWTETIVTSADIDYMAFPRLPAIAELGWSPASSHNWTAFSQRLGAQGPRWRVMGVNYYASPQVTWQ